MLDDGRMTEEQKGGDGEICRCLEGEPQQSQQVPPLKPRWEWISERKINRPMDEPRTRTAPTQRCISACTITLLQVDYEGNTKSMEVMMTA